MSSNQNRREVLKNMLASGAAITGAGLLSSFEKMEKQNMFSLKGNINHSVCRWCYSTIALDDLCAASKNMGIKAIDLVGPKDWPVLQKYGLVSAMCNGAEINLVDGWNTKQNHSTLIKNYSNIIPLVAKAGYTKSYLL